MLSPSPNPFLPSTPLHYLTLPSPQLPSPTPLHYSTPTPFPTLSSHLLYSPKIPSPPFIPQLTYPTLQSPLPYPSHLFPSLSVAIHFANHARTYKQNCVYIFRLRENFRMRHAKTNISAVSKTKDRSEWTKGVPLNNYIVSMIEDRSKLDKNVFLWFCFPCSIVGKNSDVFWFCTICVEFLCQGFFNEHRKFKTICNHCILKGPDLPKDIRPFQKLTHQWIITGNN